MSDTLYIEFAGDECRRCNKDNRKAPDNADRIKIADLKAFFAMFDRFKKTAVGFGVLF